MEVLCGESHSEQINIYVTSVRFSGGTNAMIFNYKTVMWGISSLSNTKHRFLKAAINQDLILNRQREKEPQMNTCSAVYKLIKS